MRHIKTFMEPEDGYLSAFCWTDTTPPVSAVLVSDQFPMGWAIKGGMTYEIAYDDENGNVDMRELRQ